MCRRLAFVPDPAGNHEANTLQWCFPLLTSVEAAHAARNYAPADHAGGSTDNYTPYREFTEEADTELRREELLGYMVTADTEEALRVSHEPHGSQQDCCYYQEEAGRD